MIKKIETKLALYSRAFTMALTAFKMSLRGWYIGEWEQFWPNTNTPKFSIHTHAPSTDACRISSGPADFGVVYSDALTAADASGHLNPWTQDPNS